MRIQNWKKEIFTIPNTLSFFRLVLIPVYVFLYMSAKVASDYYMATAVLTISCLTDFLDGQIARRYNMVSAFGKVLDPIADKATQLSLLLCFSFKYSYMKYLLFLFAIKEGFQLIAGFICLHKGKILNGALPTGKFCTAVLFASMILIVLFPSMDDTLVFWITMFDLICMMVSFFHYSFVYCIKKELFQPIDSVVQNTDNPS